MPEAKGDILLFERTHTPHNSGIAWSHRCRRPAVLGVRVECSVSGMPDPKILRIGDRIRILRVPDADLRQRESEIASHAELAGWTADSLERIIAQSPVVQISRIDEDGCVWYDATIIGLAGKQEQHSLIVYNDHTWEPVSDTDGQ